MKTANDLLLNGKHIAWEVRREDMEESKQFVSHLDTEFGPVRVVMIEDAENLVGLCAEDLYTAARVYCKKHLPERLHLVGGSSPFCGYCMGQGLPLLGITNTEVTQEMVSDSETGDWTCCIKITDLSEPAMKSLYWNRR
jgi:hypothetical protein